MRAFRHGFILPLIACGTLLCSAQGGLAGAQLSDIAGTWECDVDATWDQIKKVPKIAALSADQQEQLHTTMTASAASISYTFNADKIIAMHDGKSETQAVTVTKTDGDSIFIDHPSADGKILHSRLDVSAARLSITNVDHPEMPMIVLKRKPNQQDAK